MCTPAPSPPAPDPLFTFRSYSGEVNSVKYVQLSDCNAGIASGTSSGTIHLWSLVSKRPIWTQSVGSSVMLLDTCTIGEAVRLICQKKNNNLDVWDYISEKKIMSLAISNSGFCKLSTFHNSSKKCSCFATACQDSNKVNIYDLSTGMYTESFSTKDSLPKGMCMCMKSLYSDSTGVSYLMGGFEDGSLVLWDERNPTAELCTLKIFSEPVMCMTVDGGMKGVAGSVGTSIQFFSISCEKAMLENCSTIHIKNPGISDIAVRQDERIFATGGWDSRTRVFSWRKGTPLAILKYHSLTINCVTFSENKTHRLLICGSKDEIISVWKLY